MSDRSIQWSRLTLAILAAYLLVLQGVLGGLASGRHAAMSALDQAIHMTICDPAGNAPAPASDDAAKAPPCCAQGCVLGQFVGAMPPAIAAVVAYEATTLIGRSTLGVHAPSGPTDRSAGRPRAPPRSLETI